MSGATYFMDRRLVPRVSEYLASCGKRFISAEEVVDHLQKKYTIDYGRKKRKTFAITVQKAIDEIRGSKQTPEQRWKARKRRKSQTAPASPSESFSEDNENYVNVPDTNAINNRLTNMYQKSDSMGNGWAIDKKPTSPSVQEVEGPGNKSAKKKGKLPSSSFKKSSELDNFVIFQNPQLTFSDVGGCEPQLTEICKLLLHLKHPEIYSRLGLNPPKGFLLHGPPGCGKTLIATAVAGELDLPLIRVAATELVSGVSGESEEKIRQLFIKAEANAPCIVFLDEIDAITPKRENVQREMERRIVSQLLACLDDLNSKKKSTEDEEVEEIPRHVIVIGATNRLEALDPALRRAGRFDKEIGLGIPDEEGRRRILQVVCRGLRVEEGLDWKLLARLCPGYVGADLGSLAREASMCAVNRIFEQMTKNQASAPVESELQRILKWLKSEERLPSEICEGLAIGAGDFECALKLVHPSAKREGFATVPDVSWDDVGALSEVREELKWSILYPIKAPEEFDKLGLNSRPQGILLCGPPGCGKTLLAKAVANETGMNFISVKGPELLSMYVGESEKAVRQVFQRARNSCPCVIFFDELDALCPKRSNSESGGSVRVVNQLLTEMDGMETRKQVFLIGATNRPDIIDPAILRPGRLDKVVYVGFPSNNDRVDILRALTKNSTRPACGEEVDFQKIADDGRVAWFSGADLAALVQEASVAALKEYLALEEKSMECRVYGRHFDVALGRVTPSVSPRDRERYLALKTKYSGQSRLVTV